MKSKLRAVARYWFIAPLLVAVVGLQVGVGLLVTSDGAVALSTSSRLASSEPDPERNPSDAATSFELSREAEPGLLPTLTPTRRPTFTSTPAPPPSPAVTPGPTPTPTETPPPRPTSPQPEDAPLNPVDDLAAETETEAGALMLSSPLPSPPPAGAPPTPQPTHPAQGLTIDLPILMYHYLSVPPANADDIRRDLSVAPDQFEAHLAYLRQAGYETISLAQLFEAAYGQATLPPKPIILTFDDGYRDQYQNAFPLLKKYSYTATFFIFTEPIDTNNVDYLSWDMVKEMHQAGMEFGSHSYRHADLSGRDADFLVYEILGSKEAIEQRLGEPVRFFSYPAGRYDELTIRVVESANFWGAVTTRWGVEQSYERRFEMPRIRVRGRDTAADLAATLAGF